MLRDPRTDRHLVDYSPSEDAERRPDRTAEDVEQVALTEFDEVAVPSAIRFVDCYPSPRAEKS